MKFGYARISTDDQNFDLQIEALLIAGVEEENIFKDISSGAKADRKGMDLMLSKLRTEDEVIVWKMDRLARSVTHVFKLLEIFKRQSIQLRSLTEPFLDTTTPQGNFLFTIFAGMAQMERDIIIERTNAGLSAARKKGRIGGRKRGLSETNKKKARSAEVMYKDGEMTVQEIADNLNLAKATVYKYLRYRKVEIGGLEPRVIDHNI